MFSRFHANPTLSLASCSWAWWSSSSFRALVFSALIIWDVLSRSCWVSTASRSNFLRKALSWRKIKPWRIKYGLLVKAHLATAFTSCLTQCSNYLSSNNNALREMMNHPPFNRIIGHLSKANTSSQKYRINVQCAILCGHSIATSY